MKWRFTTYAITAYAAATESIPTWYKWGTLEGKHSHYGCWQCELRAIHVSCRCVFQSCTSSGSNQSLFVVFFFFFPLHQPFEHSSQQGTSLSFCKIFLFVQGVTLGHVHWEKVVILAFSQLGCILAQSNAELGEDSANRHTARRRQTWDRGDVPRVTAQT